MDVSAERLAALADRLRDFRYKVGPGQHVDACAVVGHLERHGGVPDDPAALAAYLAPIYCSNGEQQQAFEAHLRAALALPPPAPPPAPPPSTRPLSDPSAWPLLLTALIVVAAAIGIGWYVLAPHDVAVRVTVAGAPADATVELSRDRSRRVAHGGTAVLPLSRSAVWGKPSLVVRRPGYVDASRTIEGLAPIEVALEPLPAPSPPPPPSGFERVSGGTPQPRAAPSWKEALRPAWSPSRLAALAVPSLLALVWALYWIARRRAWLMRLPEHTPRRIRQLAADARRSLAIALDAGRSAHELRRRRWQPSHELNLDATLRSALERGGQPTLVFGSRVEPEYLVLIDEGSQLDHLARLADELMLSLQARDVALKRYYFRDDARRYDGPARERLLREPDLPTVALAQLQGSYPGHRLVLVSDGRPLFDAGTGRPLACVDELLQWPDPVLLTPTRRERWGRREWALSRLGFVVLPLDADGLTMLGELHGSDKPVPTPPSAAAGVAPPRWVRDPMSMLLPVPPSGITPDSLCSALHEHLGDDAFVWLQGCAVYPEIHWGMTLRIGAGLLPDDRRLARALTPLVRLPWLRESYMGEWLREALRARIAADDWQRVHDVLQAILLTADEDGSGDLPLRIASEPVRRRRSKREPPDDSEERRIQRDAVFLRFMQGPPKLAVPAFDRIRKLFFHDGVWALGLRTVPLALATAAATAALATIWWPRVEVPAVIEGPPQRVPAITALALAGDGADATPFVGYDNGEVWQVADGAPRRWRAAGGGVLGFVAAAPRRVVARVGAGTTIELRVAGDASAAGETAWDVPAGAQLALGDRDGESGSREQRATLSEGGNELVLRIGSAERRVATGLPAAPACMAFTDAGTFAAVGGGSVRVVQPGTGRVDSGPLPIDAGCAARAGGSALVVWDRSAGAAPVLWRLDPATRRLGAPLWLEAGAPVADVAISADAEMIWVLRGSRVSAYDGATGRLHGELPIDANRIATTPDGSRLALVTPSGAVEVWNRRRPPAVEPARQRVLVAFGDLTGEALALADVLAGRYGYRLVRAATPRDVAAAVVDAGAQLGAADEITVLLGGTAPEGGGRPLYAALSTLPPQRVLIVADDMTTLAASVLRRPAGAVAATRLLLAAARPGDPSLLRNLRVALEGATAPVAASDLGAAVGAATLSALTDAGHTGGDYIFTPLDVGTDVAGFAVRGGRLWTDRGVLVRYVAGARALTQTPPASIVVRAAAERSEAAAAAHVEIAQDGSVVQHLPLDRAVTYGQNAAGAVGSGVGPAIEIALHTDARGAGVYPRRQLLHARLLVQALARGLPSLQRVVGYDDIDPRRPNPGPAFPLSEFQALLTPADAAELRLVPLLSLRGHTGIARVAFSPDGTRLATYSGTRGDGSLRVWDVASGKLLLGPVQADPEFVQGFAWSGDGRLIATGGSGAVRVFDAKTLEDAAVLPKRQQYNVTSIAFSADARRLLWADSGGIVHVWRFDTRREEQLPPTFPSPVERLALVPGQPLLLAAGSDQVYVLDASSLSTRQTLKAGGTTGLIVGGSADGRLAAAAYGFGGGSGVFVWDWPSGALLHRLTTEASFALAFSADGRYLASGGTTAEVSIWNPRTGARLATAAAGADIWGVAFSPDGRRLAASGSDFTARIWAVEPVSSAGKPSAAKPPPRSERVETPKK